MRNLFRAVGGPEGRGKRGGKKEVFGEIGAELPRADVPQPHASEMLHGLGPELLEILAGIDGAIAKDVELHQPFSFQTYCVGFVSALSP